MAETTTTTERERGGGKLGAFVKRNKLLVGVAGGGGFLYFLHKNSGGTSGSTGDVANVTALAPAAPIDESPQDPVTLDPGQSVYNPNTGQVSTAPPDPVDNPPAVEGTSAPEPGPPPDVPAPAPAPAAAAKGITIAGHFFPGATGSSVVGSGHDSHGGYVIHLVHFTNRSERWYHYGSGKWSGPHGSSNATSTGSKPTSKPTSNAGAHSTSGGSSSGMPALSAGFSRGLPGSPTPWPLAGFQPNHNLLEHKHSGSGKTGHGSYNIFEIGAWDGHSWKIGRWHLYTSGDWHGQWHQA